MINVRFDSAKTLFRLNLKVLTELVRFKTGSSDFRCRAPREMITMLNLRRRVVVVVVPSTTFEILMQTKLRTRGIIRVMHQYHGARIFTD